ncbi:MAG: response regulator [Firmicutes bacterium]|nr:response regulator [Bacillota bacterium]
MLKALAVDDEALMLRALVKAVGASDDIESVAEFTSCEEALAYVRENPIDAAFLDIDMRGMGGLALAEKINEIQPECRIVFCTGYEKYAVSAIKMRVSGYLMKPVSAKDVQEEIDYIKSQIQGQKPLTVKCFGNFEAYCDGKNLTFKRSKTKELLAFLIDRKGAGVSGREIASKLWSDDGEGEKQHNYTRQLIHDLRTTLDAAGCAEILKQNNYRYYLDINCIECDYYDYLRTGRPEFHGEYMTQYSWAEETCGLLWK